MSDLIQSIHAVVGDKGLITDERVAQRPNESWGKGSCPALALVRPATTEEVSKVLALCNDAGQRVIPQAGLTGLADATKATDQDIIISLDRMRTIEHIDSKGSTALVEAGVVIQDLQTAAEEHNLLFAVDWGARGSAQVAGMLAANAGGNKVIRYGMARDQVLGLEVVLADGTVLTNLKETLKDNTGYDLKQLFVGSEGTLGLITRAVLKLWPAAPARQTALVAVDSFENALILLNSLKQRFEGKLSAFEAMWHSFYDFMVNKTQKHQKFVDDSMPYYILIESECVDETRGKEQFIEVLGDLLEQEVIADAVIAETHQQAADLWAMRDDIESMVQAFSPLIPYDISLPLRHMEAYTREVKEALQEHFPESTCITFGHLGDGNIHFCVGPVKEKAPVDTVVYEILAKYGGSVSAEHGIGLSKKPYIHLSRSEAELAVMKAIKATFDPKGILNPGKVV